MTPYEFAIDNVKSYIGSDENRQQLATEGR